jgi:hypothetical protein
MKQDGIQEQPRKPYTAPTLTRVRLEDRQVVAMKACWTSPDNDECFQDGVLPLLTQNPS